MSILLGLVIALGAAFVVLQPLLKAAQGKAIEAPVPLFSDSDDEDDPTLARRDRALAALKEIDFDRATGKLSDDDYARMKAQFTAEALEALRAVDAAQESGPTVPRSHESDDADVVEALIASARSGATAPAGKFCLECGASLAKARKFCVECGAPIGAVRT